MNDRFREALDFRRNPFDDKSSHFGDEVSRSVGKWTKSLQVPMKFQISDLFEPILVISIISFSISL